MADLYAKWQQSGKTKKTFCKDEGIANPTFHYWAKKFQGAQGTAIKKEAAFMPLVLKQNIPINYRQPVLRINYSSGTSIDFFDMVDAGYIKSLCQ